jgi:hypothetical protein
LLLGEGIPQIIIKGGSFHMKITKITKKKIAALTLAGVLGVSAVALSLATKGGDVAGLFNKRTTVCEIDPPNE